VVSGGTEKFTFGLLSGTIVRHNTSNDVAIGATLAATATVVSGSSSFDFNFSHAALTRGEAGVQGEGASTVIPEPGTLGLLGTGLIGLAGLTRRKFKLWT